MVGELALGARRDRSAQRALKGRLGSPRTVVVRLTARRSARSGVLWGYAFGVLVASSALSYTRIYKTKSERAALARAFGSNHASAALFGPAPMLQTVAGFTVLKVSMTLMVVGAVWGLLTGTRLSRGEEDAGRWDLLLCGRSTPAAATAQVLLGLGAGAACLWTLTALITVVVGRDHDVHFGVGAALFLALALVASAVVFLAVGAFSAQLASTRRQAAGYGALFLGVSFALRMVGDAGVGLHGLVWASPLGWVEELRPLTKPDALALVPLAALTAVLGISAVGLAARRDAGAGIVSDRQTARPRVRLLANAAGLSMRLLRGTAWAWAAAIAGSGLLTGIVARAGGATISGSSIEQVLTRLGAPGIGAKAFLGVTFLILAVLVSFVAAGQVSAARLEEAEGRLDALMARPVSRTAWFAGRMLVGLVMIVGGGLVAGTSSWLGATTQSSAVTLPTLLEAGVNTVPAAVLVLGTGALALGVAPRASAAAAYAVLTWSILVDLVGGFASQSHWLLDTSVFHQTASAPAVAPHWTANAVMLGIGAAGMVVGAAAFWRRDLKGS